MCGIFGIVDYNLQMSDMDKKLIFRALAFFNESRGKDASGMCVLTGEEKTIHKCDSLGRYLQLDLIKDAKVILGHTRAGTISGKTVLQAHPFSYRGYVLTHNGTAYQGHNANAWAHGPSGVDSETMLRYLVALGPQEKAGATSTENIKQFHKDWTSASYSLAILNDMNEFVAFRETNPFAYLQLKNGAVIYSSDKDHLDALKVLFGDILSINETASTYNPSEVLRINTKGELSIEKCRDTAVSVYTGTGSGYTSGYTNIGGTVSRLSEKEIEQAWNDKYGSRYMGD